MPLRLQSLELQGYKSFAMRTSFEFAEGVTAIVGPNGSGKSNISDALRWVLGEQSYLLLRGKKTEDMIFNGSDGRPRAGMAAVSISFDNHTNWLPLEFSEVAIARRAYRDGRNDYLINGQHVRLRELNELLAESGLSERTYTILGQGMVDASLALRSEDRRRLFEEAAGIGLYRSRREEALRRLEATERNLDRVLDILAELEPRLKSLERQARRTAEYRQVQQDLTALLREWYGYHWQRAGRELADARTAAESQKSRLEEARQVFDGSLDKAGEVRRRLAEERLRIQSWNHEIAGLLEQREATRRERAIAHERRRSLEQDRAEAQSQGLQLVADGESWAAQIGTEQENAARLESELLEAQSKEHAFRMELSARRGEQAEAEARLGEAREQLSGQVSRKAQIVAQVGELDAQIQAHSARKTAVAAALAAAEAAATLAADRSSLAAAARLRAEQSWREAETTQQEAGKRVRRLEQETRAGIEERSAKAAECARVAARRQVVSEAAKSLEGLADGARNLLDAARSSRLQGSRGALLASIQVPPELETAVAAALGDHLDTVLLEGEESLEQALALLEADSAGRAALLPVAGLTPATPLQPADDATCLGVASALVGASEETRSAIDVLLGQTLIIRDRHSARRILKESGAQRVVTLRGEVFRADGLVLAGKDSRASVFGRRREEKELGQALAALAAELAALDETTGRLDTELSQARQEEAAAQAGLQRSTTELREAQRAEQEAALMAEAARTNLGRQKSDLEILERESMQAQEKRDDLVENLRLLEADMAMGQQSVRQAAASLGTFDLQEGTDQAIFWSTRVQLLEQALEEGRRRLAEHRLTADRVTAQTQVVAEKVRELEQQLEELTNLETSGGEREATLERAIRELREKTDAAERGLQSAEADEFALMDAQGSAQRALQAVERENAQLQLDLVRKQEAVEALRRRVEDDFGLVHFDYDTAMEGPVPLPFGELVETLPVVASIPPELGESVAQRKGQLRRMGPINMEAHQEYEETLERFTTMSAQIEDLREAKADLRDVIAELDQLTRVGFTRTFDAVAAHFKEIFVRLFGGGSARLVLTDPDNLNETGIDIEARLPGKREQGLALLSGGERSLTAIALVFALLRVSPTPLCVLDEVDAMLDEANVGRFRDLLVELSRHTQFIVITHNRSTVQVADVIYGVTMGRDSVSQVISLRLDQVSEEMLEGGVR